MNNLKARLTVVLAMLTMLLIVPAPAMAVGVEDQIEGIYQGAVTGCSKDVANGFIGQEDLDRCVEEHYLTNLQSLLEGLRGTGRLTEEAGGVLDGLRTTSDQLT